MLVAAEEHAHSTRQRFLWVAGGARLPVFDIHCAVNWGGDARCGHMIGSCIGVGGLVDVGGCTLGPPSMYFT